MEQITIYLDDEIEKKMTKAAKDENLSKSKWIARLIKTKMANEWPYSVRELSGSWDVFPDIDEQRSFLGKDIDRESF